MKGLCMSGDIIRGLSQGDAFVIKEQLAEGVNWELYKVTALQTGLCYTMKLSRDPKLLQKEQEAMASLNTIPCVRQSGFVPTLFLIDKCMLQEGKFAFSIIDKCPGVPLNSVLNELKDYEVLYIFNELNSYLTLLEKSGYAFAELRPANIMFDRDSQNLVITDFSSLYAIGSLQGFSTGNRNSWLLGNRLAGSTLKATKNFCRSLEPQGNSKSIFQAKGIISRGRSGNSLDKVINIIGLGSLLLFISSVFYYYL